MHIFHSHWVCKMAIGCFTHSFENISHDSELSHLGYILGLGTSKQASGIGTHSVSFMQKYMEKNIRIISIDPHIPLCSAWLNSQFLLGKQSCFNCVPVPEYIRSHESANSLWFIKKSNHTDWQTTSVSQKCINCCVGHWVIFYNINCQNIFRKVRCNSAEEILAKWSMNLDNTMCEPYMD